jgi:hypothetical protein
MKMKLIILSVLTLASMAVFAEEQTPTIAQETKTVFAHLREAAHADKEKWMAEAKGELEVIGHHLDNVKDKSHDKLKSAHEKIKGDLEKLKTATKEKAEVLRLNIIDALEDLDKKIQEHTARAEAHA